MKKLNNFLICSLIILATVYLTFYVDVYTLNTILKKIFVFFYFMIVCISIVWIKRKFVKAEKKVLLVISSVIAIVLLVTFQNVFLPLEKETTIHVSAQEVSSIGCEKEVWLTGIQIDGEDISFNTLQPQTKKNWMYHSEYNNYVFYPSEELDNLVSFNVVAQKIKIFFASNSWSGAVEVSVPGYGVQTKLLESNDVDMKTVVSEWHIERAYTIFERIALNVGAFIVITFITNCILQFIVKND